MVDKDERNIREALILVHEVNLGGTAIGTGTNTHPEYASAVRGRLQQITGLPLETEGSLLEATQECSAFVLFSGVLKRTAVKLSRICSDLGFLSSGPRAGLAEINPVIPEAVKQVAFEVIGNDLTITMAAEEGQLQLSAFKPIIAQSLLASLAHLTSACTTLAEQCISGITTDNSHVRPQAKESNGVVTADPRRSVFAGLDRLTTPTSRESPHSWRKRTGRTRSFKSRDMDIPQRC